MDPADPRHIVVRATFGLLQSFDAGSTWSWICEEAVSAGGLQDPEIIVTTGGRIDMGLPDGVAVGDRSGCQWTRVPGLANDDVIDLVGNATDPATVYAVAAVTINGAFNGLVAGTAAGMSWATDGALLPDTYPLTIESAPSRPQRLYVGAEDGNLETGFIDVSDDGGASWTIHDSPVGVDSVYLSAVDPYDPDRVYLRSYFPQGSLYISEDGANTWSLIDESDVPMTGFALSPDGEQLAVGGASGFTIFTRIAADGGSTFAVTMASSLPVNCLTWTAGGLFACADEATAGFTIGLSSDGGATFTPLLRLAELTPVSCVADASTAPCAAEWCSTAMAIGASCTMKADASSDARSDGNRVVAMPSAGCACDTVEGSRMSGTLGVFALMALHLRRPRLARSGGRNRRTAVE
ncbi:MAG TPA: hypothetical protein VHG72_16780 [Polyangia bacterium]|nr:hypothetical protein [Polyangia bacterium]